MREESESETDIDSVTESSPETKSSRPSGPFSFEPIITVSENLTDVVIQQYNDGERL